MKTAWWLLLVGAGVALYTAPVVVLWNDTGRTLPPWVSPDTYLYLNLSAVTPDASGNVANPWYGITVPAAQVSYLRFPLPTRLMRGLDRMTGDWGTAMVAWHLLMAVVIGAVLLWLLRRITPDPWLLTAAFAAIMAVDALYAPANFSQIRSGHLTWVHNLPFGRTFYPQVGVPMVFGAIGAMTMWLSDRRPLWLGLVVALQVAGFISFPYAAVVIGAGLACSAVASFVLGSLGWRAAGHAIVAALLCLGLDAAWFVATGSGMHMPGSTGLLHFDLSQLQVGPTITRPLVLGVVLLVCRPVAAPVRAAIAGFSIGLAILQLADAWLTPALLFASHVSYFYTIAFWLPVVVFAAALSERLPRVAARTLLAAATVVVLVFALAQHRAFVRLWGPLNSNNGELARAFGDLSLSEADLVLVPTHRLRPPRPPLYWEASWVPLVSPARVLYSAHGRLLLSEGSGEEFERMGTYLYLRGEDRRSLDAILDGPSTADQAFLAGYGRELLLVSSARPRLLETIRRELDPPLAALERREVPAFVRAARRVIVADWRDTPELDPDRIRALVNVEREWDAGVWRIRMGPPRP
jgi:hypothetical protein